ncbi:S6 family peptidase, partial [Rahnella sp. AA]|uniref:S6 family peptidase n=1 Tax=Rahnella sp. AA TaxID=2057180 RepID=UPI0018E2D7CA
MKFKKKLLPSLILSILSGQIYPASAVLMRDDISTQVYRDFGENRGVFAAGSTNIPIYHTDGSLSGIINVMPDFSANADRGNMTLIDPQVTVTADHVTKITDASFGKRYLQLDSTLFSGAEKSSSYELMNEITKEAYTVTSPGDYKLVRQRSIVTDAAPAELFTDTSQLKAGLQIARVGGGYFTVATGVGKSTPAEYIPHFGQGSGPTAGGLNIVGNVTLGSNGIYTLTYKFTSDEKTALDAGARPGDSGSGVWAWDNISQSWKFMGIHTAHSGDAGYDSLTLYMRADPGWTQETLNSFNDPSVNTLKASDVIYIGNQNIYSGEGDLTLNGKTIRYHGIATYFPKSEREEEDYETNKNLIFGGAGGTLQLTAPNLDMGAGSLTFKSDYILSDGGNSSRRMNSAGYIINAGATVMSNLTGSAGDIWRKIGLGTLVIGGSGINHAGIYTGDGLTVLQRQGGHAADTMHISSGRAIVRLGAANQLDGTQVGFGTKGGVLDLYGQSLTWNDIIHMDNGATIGNSHANTLSNFTFTGSGPKTYLGNFFDGGSADKGLLHLAYAPGVAGSSWTLKGNVNTRGGMDITKGNLAVQGALTLHAGNYIDPTQYETAFFDLGDSLVKLTGSQFTVGRNAMARGNFVLDDASSMVVTSGGALSNSQQGIDEGAYLDGRVTLSGTNSVLKVTPEEGFLVRINAALSGAGQVVKSGAGILALGGNNDFTGGLLLSAGKTIAGNLNALGAATNIVTVAKNAILDLNGNSVLNTLNLASGTLVNSKAGALKLGTLSLSDNSTATFNGTTDTTTIGKYQLNGKRLTVNNIKTSFTDNSLTDGDIAFNSSNV